MRDLHKASGMSNDYLAMTPGSLVSTHRSVAGKISFLDLPRELRDLVYQHALPDIGITWTPTRPPSRGRYEEQWQWNARCPKPSLGKRQWNSTYCSLRLSHRSIAVEARHHMEINMSVSLDFVVSRPWYWQAGRPLQLKAITPRAVGLLRDDIMALRTRNVTTSCICAYPWRQGRYTTSYEWRTVCFRIAFDNSGKPVCKSFYDYNANGFFAAMTGSGYYTKGYGFDERDYRNHQCARIGEYLALLGRTKQQGISVRDIQQIALHVEENALEALYRSCEDQRGLVEDLRWARHVQRRAMLSSDSTLRLKVQDKMSTVLMRLRRVW